MGKVEKYTGSRLLGAELRRLRGGRSLKQISELSRSPPLSEPVSPVSAPTLSQVENGISFPSLETLHALSLLFLGLLRRKQGRWRVALRHFEEASGVASDPGDATQAFEAAFLAYRCAEDRDGRLAPRLLQRCERFHPVVQGRTPSMKEFERVAWGTR